MYKFYVVTCSNTFLHTFIILNLLPCMASFMKWSDYQTLWWGNYLWISSTGLGECQVQIIHTMRIRMCVSPGNVSTTQPSFQVPLSEISTPGIPWIFEQVKKEHFCHDRSKKYWFKKTVAKKIESKENKLGRSWANHYLTMRMRKTINTKQSSAVFCKAVSYASSTTW